MNEKIKTHLTIAEQLGNLLPGSLIVLDPEKIDAITRTTSILQSGCRPNCIIQPVDPDALQVLISFANERQLNLTVTSSTGGHRNGGIASPNENILVDLSHWQKIDLVDRRNRVCCIQPGVTYGQLLEELALHGMTLPVPLAPRSGKSVLASVMDRTPGTWPNKQWDASDPLGSTEFYFGTGERFRSGAAGGPGDIEQQRNSGGAQKFSSGPSQTDFHRVLQGAQGTMGILSWITVRTELMPSIQKNLLAGSDKLDDLLPFVYSTQRGLLGEQTFILDRTAVALLMSGGRAEAFESIRSSLPAYICLQNVAGFERLPQERLSFHLKEIGQIARTNHLRLEERIGEVSADELFTRSTRPHGEMDWRDTLMGGSHSIFFISTLDRSPDFINSFTKINREFGIPATEFGTYIQPMVQNHACHIEFILPFDPGSESKIERIKEFEKQATIQLMEAGAFFSRPYGSAAELVWDQNPANYQLLKTVKGIFDPGRVLQMDKWGL